MTGLPKVLMMVALLAPASACDARPGEAGPALAGRPLPEGRDAARATMYGIVSRPEAFDLQAWLETQQGKGPESADWPDAGLRGSPSSGHVPAPAQ